MKEGIIMLEFSIVTISAFAAAGNECVKLIASVFKKDWNKYLPIISLVIGLGLGIAGYFLPGVSMGNNIVEAIFIGLAAGASATGVHQVGHQLTKDEESNSSVPSPTVEEDVEVSVDDNDIVSEEDQIPETDPSIFDTDQTE